MNPPKRSLADIVRLMAPVRDVKEDSDPAKEFVETVFAYLESPKVVDERSIHRAPGLHASSLTSTCGRREILTTIALVTSGAKVVVERAPHTAGNTLTQDGGHMIHSWWQDHYLGPAGMLIGQWQCPRCAAKTGETAFRPKGCECGHKGTFHYQELPVHIRELGISGHSDGVVTNTPWSHEAKHRVFELKTKNYKSWLETKTPERAHVIQVHCYMKGLDLDEAIIVYVARGKECSWKVRDGQFIAGKPHVKSFLVPFDDDLWSEMTEIVTNYHEACARISKVVEDAEPLTTLDPADFPRVCDSATCSMAKKCAVSDLCFSV